MTPSNLWSPLRVCLPFFPSCLVVRPLLPNQRTASFPSLWISSEEFTVQQVPANVAPLYGNDLPFRSPVLKMFVLPLFRSMRQGIGTSPGKCLWNVVIPWPIRMGPLIPLPIPALRMNSEPQTEFPIPKRPLSRF